MLVSGKPGCGKTLSVTKTIENQIKCDENKKILFIKLNAMTFKNPLDVFEEIKTYFNEKKSKPSKIKKSLSEILKSQKEYENIILMIDEIDSLCTKYSSTQQDIFEIFKIANNPECKLILIGVSNSMELIYKIGKKCYANLEGMQNIVFKSYNFIQMMKIIQERIDDFISIQCNSQIDTKDILEENALKLCANRIYNLKGGDIRCILEVLMKSFSSQSEKINNSKSQCPEGFAISLSDLLNV